jgi:transcriptional regulator with XRE-family HTH domain
VVSQGDIEKRSGLLRCYISRVENGHTVPSVETLEKMARALEVPLYRLFHDGESRLIALLPGPRRFLLDARCAFLSPWRYAFPLGLAQQSNSVRVQQRPREQ